MSGPPTVFIAWDPSIPELDADIHDLATDVDTRDLFRALSTDELALGLIPEKVRHEIRSQSRFIAFVDRPNIQVGFEIGYALDLGKTVVLARRGGTADLPAWLRRAPLAGLLVSTSTTFAAIKALALASPGITLGRPTRAGERIGVAAHGDFRWEM